MPGRGDGVCWVGLRAWAWQALVGPDRLLPRPLPLSPFGGGGGGWVRGWGDARSRKATPTAAVPKPSPSEHHPPLVLDVPARGRDNPGGVAPHGAAPTTGEFSGDRGPDTARPLNGP
ncbi:hypothetical protein TPA0598_09_01810 [Streptomyces lydicamycinicus]|uniref:Uncharacterized protein n=1 Tax=Streptomyces lydicamycinicus TaxID=1546107 RepID=A0A0P4RF85_9ACTN|nr:hypothetical protein TPA0598_09_01810 [Streptomyces lydicamycinicus]